MDDFNVIDSQFNSTVVSAAIIHPTQAGDASTVELQPLRASTLESESRFYGLYPWSLHVFPKLRDVVARLGSELRHLSETEEEWQRREVETNIFLFCCAICESVDDFLLGKIWDFSKLRGAVPFSGPFIRGAEVLLDRRRKLRERRRRQLAQWRESWDRALQVFIRGFLSGNKETRGQAQSSICELEALLASALPGALLDSRPRIPAAFHAQDLTHFDIVKLSQKLVETVPERKRPILVVGLRTAGSYFAPLIQAHLSLQGYEDVSSVTIRPKSGVGFWEMLHLKKAAAKNALAVVIDEPGGTGSTYARGVSCVRRAGFATENVVILVPVHPTVRDWQEKPGYLGLSRMRMISLEPEEYQKQTCLRPDFAQEQLSLYFQALGYAEAKIVESSQSVQINRHLRDLSEEKSQNRLKRVYEVHLQGKAGEREVRFVLAKSVGWGWLSYHAFLAGERLAGFVPAVLGLRNGLLYSEWCGQTRNVAESVHRKSLIETAASYIATRVQKLHLSDDPTAGLAEQGRHYGSEQFADYLCHAYGGRAIAGLRRARIQQELTRRRIPYPTFIDGRMRRLEWVEGSNYIVKTDFEQHGLGKYEHSITDPAYDIAEVILNFVLTREEEEELVNKYVIYSGDATVGQRLFLNKIQAGTWAMRRALSNLVDSRLAHRQEEFHQRFTEAWNFLTVHTTQRCGNLCNRQEKIGWKSPMVVLDVDGVLDKYVFGFPSTTMAGVQAVSLLQNHGFTLALNTARTVEEVKEYCRAYGFAGGVAEYGAWAWDALTGREVTLVNQPDREQLYELARRLRELPGVFVNDRYRYSLRAYTFGPNGTVPLPTPMIETLMMRMKLDRLKLRQTSMDTTVIPRHIDKGKGLIALKALAGQENAETVMIGDTEPDLAAFAVSQRSFAPANVNCRSAAESLGCKVLRGSYQVGLLEMARSLVHPDGKECDRCGSMNKAQSRGEQDLFVHLLKVADQDRLPRLVGALCDPLSYLAFRK